MLQRKVLIALLAVLIVMVFTAASALAAGPPTTSPGFTKFEEKAKAGGPKECPKEVVC